MSDSASAAIAKLPIAYSIAAFKMGIMCMMGVMVQWNCFISVMFSLKDKLLEKVWKREIMRHLPVASFRIAIIITIIKGSNTVAGERTASFIVSRSRSSP
jgi:hypothetical protein